MSFDFRWRLGGQGEAKLGEQQLVKFFGFGVAFHVDLPTVSGGYLDIKHLDLGETSEHAAGTQASGFGLVVFFQGDVETVAEEADEDMGFGLFD